MFIKEYWFLISKCCQENVFILEQSDTGKKEIWIWNYFFYLQGIKGEKGKPGENGLDGTPVSF